MPPKHTLALLIYFFAQSAIAQTVDTLYQGNVPLQSRSATDQQTAIQAAFAQVIVKLTGQTQPLENKAVQKIISQAEQFVESFSYRPALAPLFPASDSVSDSAESIKTNTEQLEVSFQPSQVNQQLQERQLNLWGNQRPLLLTWIAVDKKSINHEYTSDISAYIDYIAMQRGIPVLYPVFDITDIQQLPLKNLRRLDQQQLAQAIQRYAPDATLSGSIYLLKAKEQAVADNQMPLSQWQVKWSLLVNGNFTQWYDKNPSLEILLHRAINKVSDQLATEFIIQATTGSENSGESFDLTVQAVYTLNEYTKLQQYLNTLDIVQSIDIMQLKHGQVILQLKCIGGRNGLANAVRLGRLLSPLNDVTQQAIYRLVQ